VTSQPISDAPQDGRRSAAAARRRRREKEILAATRELFDERGVRDAQIEDIARSVGINRAIIYRHFTGKEELFALTLVGYLEELATALQRADDATAPPERRLRDITAASSTTGWTTRRSWTVR
jgi:AcrR family transcriptional regulator